MGVWNVVACPAAPARAGDVERSSLTLGTTARMTPPSPSLEDMPGTRRAQREQPPESQGWELGGRRSLRPAAIGGSFDPRSHGKYPDGAGAFEEHLDGTRTDDGPPTLARGGSSLLAHAVPLKGHRRPKVSFGRCEPRCAPPTSVVSR